MDGLVPLGCETELIESVKKETWIWCTNRTRQTYLVDVRNGHLKEGVFVPEGRERNVCTSGVFRWEERLGILYSISTDLVIRYKGYNNETFTGPGTVFDTLRTKRWVETKGTPIIDVVMNERIKKIKKKFTGRLSKLKLKSGQWVSGGAIGCVVTELSRNRSTFSRY